MSNKFLMVRVLKECNWKCTYCEYNITDKYTALAIIDILKEFPKYNHFVPKLLKAIISDHWNLCFIPNDRVDKCVDCPVKCWIDV